MFFDDLADLPRLATSHHCVIFVLPKNTPINLPAILTITPPPKKLVITLGQIQEVIATTKAKQTTPQFIIINPADAMNEEASNAFLKSLEEPHPNYHFILVTEHPYNLLSTILSRAAIYILRDQEQFLAPPTTTKPIQDLAKRLITATPRELPDIANTIHKHTDNRIFALNVVATAIELLYKSYFITKNPKLLTKLPNFLRLYQHLQQNGLIKLHFVADLL